MIKAIIYNSVYEANALGGMIMSKLIEKFMAELQNKAAESFSNDEAQMGLAMALIPIMGISLAFSLERGMTEEEARVRAMKFGEEVGFLLREEIGG